MLKSRQHAVELKGRRVSYTLVPSRSARKLRVRVGPRGVEVVQPAGRTAAEVQVFLEKSAPWIIDQLRRIDGLRGIRRPAQRASGTILFRGEQMRVRMEAWPSNARSNAVSMADGEIIIRQGCRSVTAPAKSLETWLRKQARQSIAIHLSGLTARLRQRPGRVYVMGQRTKWGNCSAGRNLSFNWRLIHAPDLVLRYLVTHEAVHLAIPDHSAKFWLTVQSLCPESERAKQWLSSQGRRLLEPLRPGADHVR